ncbi:T9SS type A sorting domain-containing protein [Reichenbachiella ulvae]|uniref:T9SS type A sorting domain-containing protein n=1 Tax=Reichenbachiella ulvae TaxID=2980104 RepID=A0ABT3CSF4_9BACT|nr:T9SS type A sorting domain-containing protein [Reichenbachiella ulvae]MCV9386552.1 T9SS type A sorting domain-containing protein [Reichenbachiella ulvae]
MEGINHISASKDIEMIRKKMGETDKSRLSDNSPFDLMDKDEMTMSKSNDRIFGKNSYGFMKQFLLVVFLCSVGFIGFAQDSDIVVASFLKESDFDPTSFVATDIDLSSTGDELEIARFTIRDGGSTAPDADGLGTIITDFDISISNPDNINKVALYSAGSELAEGTLSSGIISFNTLTLTAPDDGSVDFSIYVTLITDGTVVDNQSLEVTVDVSTVTASGTGTNLSAAFLGGADLVDSNSSTENQIEVVASALSFSQDVSNAPPNVSMSPSVAVSIVDANGNVDTDNTAVSGDLSITSTGTLNSTPQTVTPISGVSTFDIIHTATGSTLQLTAAAATNIVGGPYTSSTFDITAPDSESDIVVASLTKQSDFDPTTYDATDIDLSSTGDELEIARFTLRDGGADNTDSDGIGTIITDFDISISNPDNINKVALYSAGSELAEGTLTAGSISFSSLTLTATDEGTVDFSIYVTLVTDGTVVDNQSLEVTLDVSTIVVSGSGSGMDATFVGGSDLVDTNTSTENQIEVTATALEFSQDASSATQYASMSPSVAVSIVDANGNVDTDNTAVSGDLSITSTGTLNSTPQTVTPISGVATFDIIHTATGSTLQLTAAAATNIVGGPYTSSTFDITAPDSESDIVVASLTKQSDFDPTTYDATDIDLSSTGDELEIARFTLRDGGADNTDSDGIGTIITDFDISISNPDNINKVALYSAGSELAEGTLTAGSISFSSLTLTATDEGTVDFSIYVTLVTDGTVVDNQSLEVTLDVSTIVVSGSGSGMDATFVGGSDLVDTNTSTENQIEVTATALEFSQDASSATQYASMSPSVAVSIVDANGNVDTDNTAVSGDLSITSTGTLNSTPQTVTPISGVATFDIIHTATGSTLQLTAAAATNIVGGPYTSSTFDITAPDSESDIVVASLTKQSDFDPTTYDATDIDLSSTGDELEIARFTLRDGGADNTDSDGIGTIITDFDISISNPDNINKVALYSAGSELAEGTLTAGSISFSSLTLTATDEGTVDFSIYVTLVTDGTVVDNQSLEVTLDVSTIVVSGSGSGMDATFVGGSDLVDTNTSTENQIEVTASDIVFTDINGGDPQDAATFSVFTATDFSLELQAQDALGNVDVDFAETVDLIASTKPGGSSLSTTDGIGLTTVAFTDGVINWTALEASKGGNWRLQATSSISGYSDQTIQFSALDASSDVVEDADFPYPEKIDYTQYTETDINGDGTGDIVLARFTVRDGGQYDNVAMESDSDTDPTTITSFEITVTNHENIDQIALYTFDASLNFAAGVELGEFDVATEGSNVFNFDLSKSVLNGLLGINKDFDIADNDSVRFEVRASFNSVVTDNDIISIAVTGVTNGGGSNFTPGGVPSSGDYAGISPATNGLSGEDNLIEVLGDRLIFSSGNPEAAGPFERETEDIVFTIQAQDANGSVDLDETSSLSLSGPSGLSLTSATLTAGEVEVTLNINDENENAVLTVADADGTTGSESGSNSLGTSAVANDIDVYDTTAPYVLSGATDVVPTIGSTMDPLTDVIQIQFSEEVSGVAGKQIGVYSTSPFQYITVDADDISRVSCDANGLVSITLPTVPTGGRSYTVNVDDGAFSDLPNNTSAVSAGELSYVSDFTGTAWTFNTVDALVLISVDVVSSTEFTLNFNKAVDLVAADATEFTITDAEGTDFSPAAANDLTDNVTGDVELELTGFDLSSAVGDLVFDFTPSTTAIEDDATNTLSVASFSGVKINYDQSAPQITSAALGGSPTTEIIVTFDDVVQSNETNPTDFTIVDGEGTGFTVVSQVDDTGFDTDILITTSGDLSTAVGDLTVTYTNSNNEIADYGGNSAPTGSVVIDNDSSNPTVTLTRNAPSAAEGTVSQTTASSVSFDVLFNEKINNAEFSLADISIQLSGATINGIGSNNLTADNAVFSGSIILTPDVSGTEYTVTVNNVAGDGTLGITLIGSGIPDFGGNFLNGGTNEVSATFGIDNSSPIVSSIIRTGAAAERTNATSVNFTVTFNKDVTNVSADGSDFEIAGSATTGAISVTPNSAQEYIVNITGVGGDGLLDLNFAAGQDIDDLGGNDFDGTSISSEETYTIDNTAPSFDTETGVAEDANIELTFNSDETGTLYYVAILDGAAAPNATQLKAGTDGADAPAAANGSINVDNIGNDFVVDLTLSAKSTYDIYYLIEDETLLNQSSIFSFLNVQTGGVSITSPVWTNLCLDGIAEVGNTGTVDLVITERIANDIKAGSAVNYLIKLPANFEFNTSVGSLTSSGTQITGTSVSYPANDILQLEFTASSASLSELNTLTVSGLEVKAKTSGTSTTTFTRFGGTANIYGANIGDPAFVLGSVASKARPSAPSISLAGTGDVTNGQFRIDLSGTFDLTASGAGGTFDWTYLDGSAAQSNTATVDETGWNTTGSFPNTFSNSNSALYTVQVQETDGDGCISDVSDVDIAVFGITLNPNTTAFTDDDDTGTLISADFPSGAHSGNYDGPGLVNEDIGVADASLATVRFRPSAAGISNNHVVSYTLTRNSDGEEFEVSRTFSVSDADETLFANVFSQYFCESSAYINNTMNVDPNPSTEPTGVYFYELEAFNSGATEIIINDPLTPPASWAGSATNPASADWSVANWSFDPTVSGPGTFRIVRYFVKDGATLPESEKNPLGNTEFIVYDLPTIDLENNLADDFCVDAADETLDAVITHGGNSANIGFTQYRIVKETTPGSGTFNEANYVTVSNTSLDFSAIADGSISASLAMSGTSSSYQIQVSSSAAQDPGDNSVNLGCTNTATAVISIYAVPAKPDLDIATMGVGYEPTTNDYVLEYCDPDDLEVFSVSGQNATTKVRWYEDDGFGGLGNLVHEEAGTASGLSTSVFDLFGTINPAVGTHVFHFTQTHYTDVTGFDGCESDFSTVTVEVYSTPANPVLDVSATGAEVVSGVYTFEYCQGAISDIVISSPSVTAGSDFYDWYDSDGVNVIDGLGIDVGGDGASDGASEGIFAAAGNTTITGTEFFSYFGESPTSPTAGTYTLYFAKRENKNTNGTFDGCSSSLQQIDVVIYDYPVAPVLSTALSDLNACSGEVDLNSRIASTDEISTPQTNNVRYSWYDASTGGASIANADGSDVTYGDVVPSLTADQGTAPTDGASGFYELTATYSATAYLSQTTNLLGSSRLTTDFGGCESSVRTAVDITIYPLESAPVVLGPSDVGTYTGGTNEVLNYEAGVLSASNTFDASTSFTVDATYEQNFNWFISNSSGDKFSQISVVATRDASAAANELGLTGIPSDVQSYFLVNQTTSIEISGDFDGCQSDFTTLQINTWDKPSEPTEINGDTELYYCYGDAVQPIQVVNNSSDNSEPNLKYVWYRSETDALNRTNALTSTNLTGAEGEYINPIDLLTDETRSDGGTNMSGTPEVGSYTFYVTVNKDSGVTGSDENFPGGESDPLELTILIRSIPETPTLVNGTPTICDGATIPTFQVLNSAGERFTWVFDANSNNTNDDTPLVDELFQSNFTPSNTGAGVYTYFVTQVTDKGVSGSSFAGCESTALSFDYTINDIPAPPTIDGNNGNNVYEYCADATISSLTIANETDYNGTATFNWYSSSSSTGLISTSQSTDGSEILATDHPLFPTVDRNTDQTINYYVTVEEDGCESSEFAANNNTNVTVTIFPIPDLTIEYATAAGGNSIGANADGTEICYDEASFSLQAKVDGVNSTGGSFAMYASNADALSATSAVTGGFTDNGNGTASFDPAAVAVAVGETREGSATTVYVRYNYTDGTTSCGDYIIYDITINPQPSLDISYDGTFYDDDAASAEANSFAVCYEEGSITLQGVQEGAFAFAGSWSVSTGNSALSTTSGGSVSFDLQVAAANAGTTEEGVSTDHVVTYTFNDANSCQNSVSITITVNPRPTLDIVYDTDASIDGTALCYDNGLETLTGIQEGIDAISTDGTITWSVNTGGFTNVGSTVDFTPSTAAISAGESEEGLPSTHNITFGFTESGTGCSNTITSTVTVNPLPTVDVVFNGDYANYSNGANLADAELCYEDASFSVRGKETSGSATSSVDASIDNGSIYWFIKSGTVETNLGTANTATINLKESINNAGTDSLGIPTDHIVTFLYTDDGDGRTGCSNSITKTITINPLPKLDIVSGGAELEGQEFCFDDQTAVVQGTQETGAASESNATSGSWILNTGNNALTDNLNGSAVINLQTAMTNSGSSRTDNITNHQLTFSYTDVNGCDNQVTRNFVVNPQPVLSIVYDHDLDGGTSEIDLDGSAVCYEDVVYTFQGTHATGNATSASFATSNSTWSANTLVNGSSNGTATFSASQAAAVAGQSVATGEDTDHAITFNYTDVLGCSNSVTQTITVTQLPTLDVVFPNIESGSQSVSGEYCATTTDVEISGVVEGVSAASGIYDLESGSSGITSNGDGTAIFHPDIAHSLVGGVLEGNASDATSHIVSFTHTSSNTGCTNTIKKTVVVNPLSTLEFSSIEEPTFENVTEFVICESNEDFVVSVTAPISGDNGRFFVNGNSINLTAGNITRATFEPSRWGSEEPGSEIETLTTDGISADYTLRYEYDDQNGCTNSIEKTIVLYDQPKVSFEIDGGCVTPSVKFSANTLPESNYLESDLTYEWAWYTESDAPVPLFTTNGVQETNEGRVVRKKLQLTQDDILEEIFEAQLIATYTMPNASNTNTGCASILENGITIQDVPVTISPTISFVWDSVTVNRPTSFFVDELKLESFRIDSIGIVYSLGADTVWTDISNAGLAASEDFSPIEYVYNQPGVYDVTMTLTTRNTCRSSLQRKVQIVPSISVTPDNPYVQTFESGSFDPETDGWYAETLKDNAIAINDTTGLLALRDKSWVWKSVDFDGEGILTTDPDKPITSGPFVWSTLNDNGSNKYLGSEDSWLYSPEFDLSAMTKPMVSFNTIYQFEDSKDGVVFQYSIDNGQTWVTLGSNEGGPSGSKSGLEWFNWNNIGADPGQQQDKFGALTASGWSGIQDQLTWVSARHSLDVVQEGRDHVRFRFAIASTPESGSDKPFGFAFDDFVIQERSKSVLVEQFYSVSDDEGADLYNTATAELGAGIDALLESAGLSSDQLSIAYHVTFDNDIQDPFNTLNSVDPSARRSWYQVDQVTSLLDGDYGSNAGDGTLTWTQNDLVLSSLADPGFTIDIFPDATATEGEIKGSVSFTVNTPEGFEAGEELIAFVAIIERTVIETIGGIDEHKNVLRKLLPNASGQYIKLTENMVNGDVLPIGSANDADGDPTTLDVQWDLANISDDAELAAVVFIQNRNTKEVYQAKMVTADGTTAESNLITSKATVANNILASGDQNAIKDYMLYPNPSDQEVSISFGTNLDESLDWVMYDQTGRVFEQGVVPTGLDAFKLSTSDYPSGVYFISVQGKNYKFDIKKLLIHH